MTLFAGFKCAYQHALDENIFVVCADSQETIENDGNSYRVTRQKIKPRECGNFELAIGGSSTQAKLLDASIFYIQTAVSKFAGRSLPELQQFISNKLLEFGRKDAKLYSKEDRVAEFIILARSRIDSSVGCWHTKAAQLVPVEKRELIGFNEWLYEHVLDRLYPENGPLLPPQQAVLLGMYLLKLAEDTSNCVRGPITVVIAHGGTIRELPPEKVKKFQERIDLFRAQVDSLLLSLSDHTIRRSVYEAKLDEFKATALQLRDEYVQDSAPKSVEEIMTRDDVIPDFPVGGVVYSFGLSGPPIVNEDVEKIAKWQKKIELTKINGGAGPIKLTVHCKCAKDFEVELPNYQTLLSQNEFACNSCGETNRVTTVTIDDIRLL